MATLLKGHTHLQGEFSLFFDELRPPPARPGQFEEALWPEETGSGTEGGDGGVGMMSGGGVSGGFEEVTLPDLEEEEETHKIPQITGKSRRRKELGTHRNYKVSKDEKKMFHMHRSTATLKQLTGGVYKIHHLITMAPVKRCPVLCRRCSVISLS